MKESAIRIVCCQINYPRASGRDLRMSTNRYCEFTY